MLGNVAGAFEGWYMGFSKIGRQSSTGWYVGSVVGHTSFAFVGRGNVGFFVGRGITGRFVGRGVLGFLVGLMQTGFLWFQK